MIIRIQNPSNPCIIIFLTVESTIFFDFIKIKSIGKSGLLGMKIGLSAQPKNKAFHTLVKRLPRKCLRVSDEE